ncbi:hypothetical protein RR42_m1174 [Cupriavidus basilensis]|uniref:Uncharacterized protein n=1 Tax=Cupriavidus basilensis TaxID=68895 RepID=A0A0C4Y6D2_9BURK|nr:hypothetical protein RR42_m1174 [Cupriavidus basilensis]
MGELGHGRLRIGRRLASPEGSEAAGFGERPPSPPAPLPLAGEGSVGEVDDIDPACSDERPVCIPLPLAGEVSVGEVDDIDPACSDEQPVCSPLPPAGEGLGERAGASTCPSSKTTSRTLSNTASVCASTSLFQKRRSV